MKAKAKIGKRKLDRTERCLCCGSELNRDAGCVSYEISNNIIWLCTTCLTAEEGLYDIGRLLGFTLMKSMAEWKSDGKPIYSILHNVVQRCISEGILNGLIEANNIQHSKKQVEECLKL